GRELLGLSDRELAAIRGDRIGMVFQEPKTALSPFRRLGTQMTEALAIHYHLGRAQRREAALRLARQVGLRDPERIVRAYPHEVSGGQRQRAAIAAAISASPGLLLADEPTTALDVTVQRGILELFTEITDRDECSLVCITHDIAVVNQVAERVLVFRRRADRRAGQRARDSRAPHPRGHPGAHRSGRRGSRMNDQTPAATWTGSTPWTGQLNLPDAEQRAREAGHPLVELTDVSKEFRTPARKLFERGQVVRALDGASLTIERG
ncbi:ABC transporter family protein, partial [Leucobacter komagatae]